MDEEISVNIEIRATGFRLSAGVRAHAERRIRFAFGSTSNRVRSVSVRLADNNGPRGGIDKRCLIEAIVPGLPPVVVEQCEPDLAVAIDRAADRAGRTVARWLKKAIADRRGPNAAGANGGAFPLY